MKIAVVTEDKISVCPHFGHAPYYAVYEVDETGIVHRETREKAGHHSFQNAEPSHETKHALMAEAIRDCSALLVGGMGAGARKAMEAAGISCHAASDGNLELAVQAYLAGRREPTQDCSGH